MSPLTTHVLDLASGQPANGLRVTLEKMVGPGTFEEIAHGTTNNDGRITDLVVADQFVTGIYRLNFDTGAYHKGEGFFPAVNVTFSVKDAKKHHHVPILLSPFGYSTYRGS